MNIWLIRKAHMNLLTRLDKANYTLLLAQLVEGSYPETQEHENVESESLVHVPPCLQGKLWHGSSVKFQKKIFIESKEYYK